MSNTPVILDPKTIDALLQLGAIGVLFILGFALLLWIWTRRNYTPADSTVGTNAAITAFGEIFRNVTAEITADRLQRKEENQTYQKQFDEMNGHYVESNTAMADGINRLADNLSSQTVLLQAINSGNQMQSSATLSMQDALRVMTEQGSQPLRTLITTAERIEIMVAFIRQNLIPCPELQTLRTQEIQIFQSALDSLRADVAIIAAGMQNQISDKRKTTDTNSIVTIPATANQRDAV